MKVTSEKDSDKIKTDPRCQKYRRVPTVPVSMDTILTTTITKTRKYKDGDKITGLSIVQKLNVSERLQGFS